MVLPNFLLGMPKGTTGSPFGHPETLGQHPKLPVEAGHVVTALLQPTHFRRNFPRSRPILRQLRRALHLILSSPGSLAFLSSYISKDTLPPAGRGKQGKPQTFSICCLKSTTFCSWGSQATQQEMY